MRVVRETVLPALLVFADPSLGCGTLPGERAVSDERDEAVASSPTFCPADDRRESVSSPTPAPIATVAW
jgi:hypothetical protein